MGKTATIEGAWLGPDPWSELSWTWVGDAVVAEWLQDFCESNRPGKADGLPIRLTVEVLDDGGAKDGVWTVTDGARNAKLYRVNNEDLYASSREFLAESE